MINKTLRHMDSPAMSLYDRSTRMNWSLTSPMDKLVVYTEGLIRNLDVNNTSAVKIAYLIEPRVINPHGYNFLENGGDKYYDYIISHDLRFLENFTIDKRVWCPGSGSFIHDYEWNVYPKKELVQFIVGNKRDTEGHKFRYEITNKLRHKITSIVGRGFVPFGLDAKCMVTKDFMYQICVHNCIVEDYWTDILVDCIAIGTVPIVHGGKFLEKYFNMDGIIIFDTIEELDRILSAINEDDYNKRLDAIKKNKEIMFSRYRIVEDYLYDSLFYKFVK